MCCTQQIIYSQPNGYIFLICKLDAIISINLSHSNNKTYQPHTNYTGPQPGDRHKYKALDQRLIAGDLVPAVSKEFPHYLAIVLLPLLLGKQ